MEFKSLLNISIILSFQIIFFGCSTKVENTKNVENKTEIKSKLKKKKDCLIEIAKKDTLKFYLINDTSKPIVKDNKSNREDKITSVKINDIVTPKDKDIEGTQPKEGTEYIIYPKTRTNDSINLFENNYERLMRTLIKQGINSRIERDSLLWEEWQKMLLKYDNRHKKVEFNRNMKFGNKKE